MSIPGGGRAEPDRNRGWTDPLGIGCRAEVIEPAVRPESVVLLAVVSRNHPAFGQGVELFPVQAFIPEAPVEAFHEAVLPGTSRLNVQSPDPIFLEPPLHDGGDELWTVVASQIPRRSMLLDRLLKPF